MSQVGYSLIDTSGNEIAMWGDTFGQCADAPEYIDLPNGDRVYCPEIGGTFSDWRLVPRWLEIGAPSVSFDGEKITVVRSASTQSVIPADIFLQRVTDTEYQAVLTAALSNVLFARWVDLLRINGKIDVAGDTAIQAKAAIVAASIMTADRSEKVFAPIVT